MGSEFEMNCLNPGIRESRCCRMLKASAGCTGVRLSKAAVLAPKVAEHPTETMRYEVDSENSTRPVLYTKSRDVTFFISVLFLFIHS